MRRRGAVLLELVVALGILVMAASVLLAAFTDMSASIERDGLTARAADLARTRMSELEAGLMSIEDLRAESGRHALESSRSKGGASGVAGAADGDSFRIDATVERTEFTGLSLVVLRVYDASQSGEAMPRFVLRQLVALPEARRIVEEEVP